MKHNPLLQNYWTLDIDQVLTLTGTTRQGLTTTENLRRLDQYGDNTLRDHSEHGILRILGEQFLSPLIWILIFAGVITGYLGEFLETGVIFSAVLINILFAFYQEYRAERTIDQLRSYIKNRTRVLRDGILHDTDAKNLVVGDIVSITHGNRIPADGRIIESIGLHIDESILTGEALPVLKQVSIVQSTTLAERTNSVFGGTYVTEGVGLFVVTATGSETEIGKIATSVTQTKHVKTPVQQAVKQISWYVFLIALVIVFLIFFLGIIRGENIFDMLILSSAVAVGAVPEALPITLTVILSVGVLAISQKGGLVRKLSAAETLGSTTLILTDKTGTLTTAEFSLETIFSREDLLTLNHYDDKSIEHLTTHQAQAILQSFPNIQATVEKIGPDPSSWIYSGGAFDVIILKSIHRFKIPFDHKPLGKLLLPFNSSNKYSISLLDTTMTILGAPDILIHHSQYSDQEKIKALEIIAHMASQGKRMVALGEKIKNGNDESLQNLTLKALFVFSDPIREDVAESITAIQSKGVRVKIITGDMIGTARSVAHRVGISAEDHELLTGDIIKSLDDTELKKLLPHITVFARTTPEDKLRIGNLYRTMGEIVAMTGDGVNDAPALKSMDIGISLGSASDVAKSAADMILLDNHFKTITNAITEGYKIRSNIQKTFVYLMSNSLDEVFVIAGALIAGLAIPLTALQIIWINMLTGTLPALAFAYDEHTSTTKDPRHGIFDFRTKFLALGIGTLSSFFLFALYVLLVKIIPDPLLARSLFFVCFGTYVLTISYSFKNMEKFIFTYNPFTNIRLNVANLFGLGLIIATVTIPFLQEVFTVTSIPLRFIWIILLWNVFNIALIESAKWTISYIAKKHTL